jgi:hypothetical protein
MAAQKATAFQTAKNIQSVLLNLAFTVGELLPYVYQAAWKADTDRDAKLKETEQQSDFATRLKTRVHFYTPEITAITNFLLDERNLSVVQIIGNDVFWIDAASMRQIAKQLQSDLTLAFDDSKPTEAKEAALRDILERAKLIDEDLKESRVEISRLEEMTQNQYEAAYPPHKAESFDPRVEKRSPIEKEFLRLLEEREQLRGSDDIKKDRLDYLIRQKAILVYAEKRAEVALDFLKKLFTPGYVSLENADAKDGNLLTLTVEARSSDADSGGAAVVFEVAIRSFGAKLHLGPTMMFLNRKGVSENDGSMLTPINYAPSPGMNFGITWFKRGDTIWDKVLRGLAPGVGVNVSFMNFKDPGFDQVAQKFTNTTGTDVQVGAGPYVSFFNNKIDVTTGWNLNVDKKRRYFGLGFEFINIGNFLRDKVTNK